jgi:Uma2 family endonuclease
MRMAGHPPTLISLEEYRANIYEPDCDYVDGELEERNLGERAHARLQAKITALLINRYEPAGFLVLTEMRVQVKPTRFRIPDICVTIGDPGEEVFTTPPFLCVEILSPEDRMSRVETRINDYLEMGVAFVWVLDPQTRQAYVATKTDGLREVKNGVLKTESPELAIPLSEVFA